MPKSPEISIFSLPTMASRGFWRLAHLHARPEHRFFWITRGQGTLAVGTQKRGYGPNSLLFVPAGLVHALLPSNNTQGFAAFLPDLTPVPVPDAPALIKATSIFEQGQLTGYFEQMSLEFSTTGIGREHALESHLTLLSVWVSRNLVRNDWKAPFNPNAARRLAERFLYMLETAYHTERSVSGYAAELDVTPTHLSRVCCEILGQPASKIIQTRKIQAARYHLADDARKVSDIAAALGFASPAYFSRAFSVFVGQSPRDFRARSARHQLPAPSALRRVRTGL